MKEKKSLVRRMILFLAILGATGVAQAQFSYNGGLGEYGDLLVCFRASSGTYDLVVDAGPVSNFITLPVGQKITVNPTYYNGSQLAYLGTTNNLHWSALACQRLPGIQSTNSIWVTRPRASLNAQTSPWPCKNASQQSTAASQIDSIGNDAADIASGGGVGVSPTNSATFVVEPHNDDGGPGGYYDSYTYLMTSSGNLGGNFWGDASGVNLEQTTPANFTTAGQPVRADFYQLISTTNSSQLGTYLGYFEFSTNGVLVYTAGPSPTLVTAPTIVSIVRNGTTNTISFTTVSGGTYTLCGTNSAGLSAARTNWPAIGSSLAGNGFTNSLMEVTTNDSHFYIISAQ
jgi:hypothetical protein